MMIFWMNEINLMKKLLYLLVMLLILAACNPKVELTSAGMYPNYQVGEIVNLIPVDSLTYGDVIAYHSYIPGFRKGHLNELSDYRAILSAFRISNVS